MCVCVYLHASVCLCVVVIELLLCFVLKVGLYVMKGKVIYKWGGGEDHVTKIMHPDDPQLGFLTIMAAEAMKGKKD